VTNDFIRLEYNDTTDEYRRFARLINLTEEEKQTVPDWILPIDVQNNTAYGAGATIFLCRKRILDYFSKKKITSSKIKEENM